MVTLGLCHYAWKQVCPRRVTSRELSIVTTWTILDGRDASNREETVLIANNIAKYVDLCEKFIGRWEYNVTGRRRRQTSIDCLSTDSLLGSTISRSNRGHRFFSPFTHRSDRLTSAVLVVPSRLKMFTKFSLKKCSEFQENRHFRVHRKERGKKKEKFYNIVLADETRRNFADIFVRLTVS